MGVSLDLRKAHKAHLIGDICAILTWVNDERALVLLPAHRAPGSPWFIILESAAYKYDNPLHCARMGAKAAEVLGMDETTSTAGRVIDIILNYLPDLIRMPSAPEPEFLKAAYGKMTLREDGQDLAERDIQFEAPKMEFEAAHG